MQKKQDDSKIVMEILGWVLLSMIVGVPVLFVLGCELGIGCTEWGLKLVGNGFWCGLFIFIVLSAIAGPYIFEPDKKKRSDSTYTGKRK